MIVRNFLLDGDDIGTHCAIVTHGYHLNRDRVRRELVRPHRYSCLKLSCDDLNVAEGLQHS